MPKKTFYVTQKLINKMKMQIMNKVVRTITGFIGTGHKDIIGQAITLKFLGPKVGIITKYNTETGEAVAEINNDISWPIESGTLAIDISMGDSPEI